FLYTLFIAIDANFRLKRKNMSSNNEDPSLSNGWSYFVPKTPFKDFLQKHDKIIPQPSLAGTEIVDFVVSYDIACQWSINLWERMKHYPCELHIDHKGNKFFRFMVPKFHLPVHVMACQTPFSFNFNSNVGRTDGEAPERGWSHINPIAMSTCKMGPGHCRDTIDDHFGDWNWKKTCLMAPLLLRKVKEAVVESKEHRELHAEFEGGLEPELVSVWQAELTAWEADHTKPNPFEKRYKSTVPHKVEHSMSDLL
ncbi:hypothetical protein H0H81_005641, partial [Sphagnurus paluster]